MTADNLLYATNSMRGSIASLKKKLSNLKVNIELFDAELEKIEGKFDNILTQAEVYKAKLERELGREVRRLEKELATASKTVKTVTSGVIDESDFRVASTIGIFDSLLRHMCANAEDFRLASEAFLFPVIYERVMSNMEEAYFLDEVPISAPVVICRGQDYIQWIRSEYDTHLTDPETWENAIEYIVEWWRNDALPMIYGARDDQWDIDMPLSLPEILLWRESPGDRPLNFPKIFDAYEIFRKHKDEVYGTAGLREFELKFFAFENEETPQPRFGPR
jgi:hypothetical protein